MAASMVLVDYSSDESDDDSSIQTEQVRGKQPQQQGHLHLQPLKEGESVLSLHKKVQLNAAPLVEPSHALEVQ